MIIIWREGLSTYEVELSLFFLKWSVKKPKRHQGRLCIRYCFRNSFFQMSVVIFIHLWSLILQRYIFIDGSLAVKVPESGNFWPIIIAKLYCFDVNKKKHFISNINQLFGKTPTLYILKTKKTDVNLNDPDFAILDMELIPPRAKITIFGPQILIKRINWENVLYINPYCYCKVPVQVK